MKDRKRKRKNITPSMSIYSSQSSESTRSACACTCAHMHPIRREKQVRSSKPVVMYLIPPRPSSIDPSAHPPVLPLRPCTIHADIHIHTCVHLHTLFLSCFPSPSFISSLIKTTKTKVVRDNNSNQPINQSIIPSRPFPSSFSGKPTPGPDPLPLPLPLSSAQLIG